MKNEANRFGENKSNAGFTVLAMRLLRFAVICYLFNLCALATYSLIRNAYTDEILVGLNWISPSVTNLADRIGHPEIELMVLLWVMSAFQLVIWIFLNHRKKIFARTNGVAVLFCSLVFANNFLFFGYFSDHFVQFGRNGRSIFEEATSSLAGVFLLGNLIVVAALCAAAYIYTCISNKNYLRSGL